MKINTRNKLGIEKYQSYRLETGIQKQKFKQDKVFRPAQKSFCMIKIEQIQDTLGMTAVFEQSGLFELE